MNRRIIGILGISLICFLLILVIALPVSGVGLFGLHDGSGNHAGHHAEQSGGYQHGMSGSGTCIDNNCPDGSSVQDRTCIGHGMAGNGCKNDRHSGINTHRNGHGFRD